MTRQISSLLKKATQKIDRFDAEILLAHVLQKPREFVIAHPEYCTTTIQYWKMNRLIRLRAQGIPYAHLTGRKGFYGFDFIVNKHTLVPRPETEVLVEHTLKAFPPLSQGEGQGGVDGRKNTILVDVGTGTGCIPISIIKSLSTSDFRLATFGIDISNPALKIARKNAQKYNVNVTFLHGNLLEPFLKNYELLPARRSLSEGGAIGYELIITANLPYLTQIQFDTEPTIQHEPISALVTEDDGLKLYKELLKQIKQLLTTYKLPLTTFFEIDPSQTTKLSHYIQNNFPNSKIEVIKDGMGNDRVVKTSFTIDKS